MAAKQTRKITYTAAATAIAVCCILISRFLPLKFTPLMVASLCFFIALKCGIGYGFACMAASMLLTFFWGSVDITIILIGIFFAPYSLLAYILKKKGYKNKKDAVIRICGVVILFNIALAITVFCFFPLVGKLFLGFDVSSLADKLGNKALAYMLISLVGSALSVGFDMMFVMTDEVLSKRIKL